MRSGPRVNPIITGALTIAVCLVMVAIVLVSGLPGGPPIPGFPHGVRIKVALADADALAPHAAVQVAGVKIGEVQNVDLASDNTAMVTMTIDNGHADIHADAIAKLRPHGLFGPKFIDLVPGTTAAPLLHDGDTIPGTHTVQPVDLDQVLQELQTDERVNLQTVIVELGKAAAGRGDDVNHLVQAARSVSTILDGPVARLDQVAPNLSDFLVKDESFNASFAQVPLDQLISASNTALAAFADNSDHLQSVLVHANGTLSNLDAALTGHVQDLRATIEQLPGLMDHLAQFNHLLSVFGANLTGKEPGTADVTPGLIGAIENVRSAFSSSDPCTPGVGNCPADGRAHYVRVQTFNVSPIGNVAGAVCAIPAQIPQLGQILGGLGILSCPTAASATAAPPAILAGGVPGTAPPMAGAATVASFGALLTP